MDDGGVTLLDSVQTDAMELHAPPTVTAPSTTQPRVVQGPRAGAPVVHQSWPIDGGTLVFEIRSDKPLPATAYAMVGEVVATLERLAGTLAPGIGEVRIPTEVAE
jgi:hypothetical protein